MKIFQMVVATAVAIGLATTAATADAKKDEKKADDKPDIKKLIVGKWEAVKVDEGTLPKGAIVEFSADGKMKVIAKKGDKDETVEGTYTLGADSFTYKLSIDKKEFSQKITVKKISADEMDTASPEGKSVTFKKAK